MSLVEAKEFKAKSKTLMEGPTTAKERCESLNMQEASAINEFCDENTST